MRLTLVKKTAAFVLLFLLGLQSFKVYGQEPGLTLSTLEVDFDSVGYVAAEGRIHDYGSNVSAVGFVY